VLFLLYVYITCFTFGVLYSIVSAIFGSLGGGDHGGIDDVGIDSGEIMHGSIDHGSIDLAEAESDVNSYAADGDTDTPSPLNPTVLFSSIAAFGAIGLIGKLGFSMTDLASALMSLACAGIVGTVMFFGVVKLIYSSQSNTRFSINDTIGLDAEVNIPIPAEGLGEIVCIINGMRHTMAAKSYDSVSIGRNETVKIRKIAGNVAIVSRKINIYEYTFDEAGTIQTNETENGIMQNDKADAGNEVTEVKNKDMQKEEKN